MKLKKMMLGAAFAATVALGAVTASAVTTPYPSIPLAVSGSLAYINTSVTTGAPVKRLSYTTQTLINLLNASPNASNDVFMVTGKTKIPAGSYFIWNPYDETLTITNKDGFSFPLDQDGYDYGDLYVDRYDLIGTYSINNKTLAGTETDVTGIYFYFYDGQHDENEIELYGTATLHWTYGVAKNGSQKATLTVTMTGCGNDDSYVDGNDAIPTSFSATGTGAASESTGNVPFYVGYF